MFFLTLEYSQYTVKKGNDFPVPSRDITNQIFLLEPKGWGGGESCVGLFYCEYSKVLTMKENTIAGGE